MGATKDQERKALEQIRKIVEGLGSDSYVGTAFEGCFEIAESNIENDFACSLQQRAEGAEIKIRGLEEHNRQLKLALEAGEKNDETMKRTLVMNAYLKKKADNQAAEIITLKAKLYDLMTQ
jgi:hypothetical protein